MKHVICIPTLKERTLELRRCVKSIADNPSFTGDMKIIVLSTGTDYSLGDTMRRLYGLGGVDVKNNSYAQGRVMRSLYGIRTLYYTTQNNLDRLAPYLSEKLGLNPLDVLSFLRPGTYGGVRNSLSLLANIVGGDDYVEFSLDDDVVLEDDFFTGHLKFIGKRAGKKTRDGTKRRVDLVTGPYTGHGALVGLSTIDDITKGKMKTDAQLQAALRSLVSAPESPRGVIYHVDHSAGGNQSRYGNALDLPFVSGFDGIGMRGEDSTLAKLHLKLGYGFERDPSTNIFTPVSRVHHVKRGSDLFEDTKGEIIGIMVNRFLGDLLYRIERSDEYGEGFEKFSQRVALLGELVADLKEEEIVACVDGTKDSIRDRLSDSLRKLAGWDCRSYDPDSRNEVLSTIRSIERMLNTYEERKDWFLDRVVSHLDYAQFGFSNWHRFRKLIDKNRDDVRELVFWQN